MRILQINAVYGILSTGRTAMELSNELNALGHESFIAYSLGKAQDKNNYKIGNFFDKKLHALCSRIFGLQGYYSTSATLKLIHYMKSIQPDIVHLRNLHGNYINLSKLFRFLAKHDMATVITLHDCWFYTGRCTHYTLNNCYQWQDYCYKCPNNNNNMPSWFFDRSKKMFKDKKKLLGNLNRLAIVGVSKWITVEAKNSFLSNATFHKTIYNWVNLDIFKPSDERELRNSFKLQDKFVIIGVSAQWEESKGISDFIELGNRLKNDTAIILVGKIKGKYVFPNNMILIPPTNDCELLAKLYSLSDVLISLSKEESFGKVIAEGIACGTPAIVYNSTASPELVGKDCGYITKENNLEEVAKGILEIKNHGKSYYSVPCRTFALNNFNLHRGVKEYIKVYQTLLGEKRD